MSDSDILKHATLFAQYKDAKEPTLRGQGIIDFVRGLSADQLRELLEVALKVGME